MGSIPSVETEPPSAQDADDALPPPTAGDILCLPDTLANWPWQRRINPHYKQCKKESSAWAAGFKAFSARSQAAFDKCDFNLLAALAYPELNKDGCRVGCDLMNLFFIFDELSDVATATTARIQADSIMDALRNPHKPRPAGEWVGGEVARQFWLNALKTATKPAQDRFLTTFSAYCDAVVEQAADRDHGGRIRDIASYFTNRRDNIGAKPSCAINEIHFHLPDRVMSHPVMVRLTELTVDMVIIGNDLCSWNVEQSRGDDAFNLVTVARKELKLRSVQETLDWIGRLHDGLVEQFLEEYARVPTMVEPDDDETLKAQVFSYACQLGNWVRAADQWSFESQRYFGKAGLQVMESRKVVVLPPKGAANCSSRV